VAEVIQYSSITVGTPIRYLTPRVDIYETDKEIVIIADMPGVSKDRIEVNAINNQLAVVGRFQIGWEGTRLIRECPNNDYYRTFTLSDIIDAENIQAKISDGILMLSLPKKPSAQRHKILIETE